MKRSGKAAQRGATKGSPAAKAAPRRAPARPAAGRATVQARAPGPHAEASTVAKVSHTLSPALARRLEEFAFFQRMSESAVIEHALARLFGASRDDDTLGESLRREGAGRRRRS